MVSKEYEKKINDAWKVIKPLFEEKLAEIAGKLGINPEIEDFSDEEYGLEMAFSYAIKGENVNFTNWDGKCDDKLISMRATLYEELVTEGEGKGMAIGFTTYGYEGRVLNNPFNGYPGIPYNRTEVFWTSEIDELKSRIDNIDAEVFSDYLTARVSQLDENLKVERKKCK